MADVEVRHDSSVTETSSTTKKTKKVKKTKRRESADQGSEITITEIEQTTTENPEQDEEGYVNERNLRFDIVLLLSFSLSFSIFAAYFSRNLSPLRKNSSFNTHFLSRRNAACNCAS